MRFLELRGSDLIIVDWPSTTHESGVRSFDREFSQSSGNQREIGNSGLFTAQRGGNPNKEADATFGPLRNTPHRRNPPAGVDIGEWATVVVEVAVSQNWRNLENAALSRAKSWRYRLYSMNQVGVVPPPHVDQQFFGAIAVDTHILTFDARRILAIPGVNAQIIVDLYPDRESESFYKHFSPSSGMIRSNLHIQVNEIVFVLSISALDHSAKADSMRSNPQSPFTLC